MTQKMCSVLSQVSDQLPVVSSTGKTQVCRWSLAWDVDEACSPVKLVEAGMTVRFVVLLFECAFVELFQAEWADKVFWMVFAAHGSDTTPCGRKPSDYVEQCNQFLNLPYEFNKEKAALTVYNSYDKLTQTSQIHGSSSTKMYLSTNWLM